MGVHESKLFKTTEGFGGAKDRKNSNSLTNVDDRALKTIGAHCKEMEAYTCDGERGTTRHNTPSERHCVALLAEDLWWC